MLRNLMTNSVAASYVIVFNCVNSTNDGFAVEHELVAPQAAGACF